MSRTRPHLGVSLAAVILLVTGGYLGVRAWSTVREVLSPDYGEAVPVAAAETNQVAQAMERDAHLEAVDTPRRDPFHAPRRAARRTSPTPAEPEVTRPPIVRMLLFDEVSPEVQIEVAGQSSGRLKVGSSFRGWTVVSISENKVVVSKDGETHTLRL